MINRYKNEIKLIFVFLIFAGCLWFVVRQVSIDFLAEKFVEVPHQQHYEEMTEYQVQFTNELVDGKEVIFYRQGLYLFSDEQYEQNRKNILTLLNSGYAFILELGDKTLVFRKEKAGA